MTMQVNTKQGGKGPRPYKHPPPAVGRSAAQVTAGEVGKSEKSVRECVKAAKGSGQHHWYYAACMHAIHVMANKHLHPSGTHKV
jgi:hypothetical protein